MIEFHADDYGMFPAAARRIIHCINEGSLNGISLMPNGLYLDDCMRLLKEECTKEVRLAIHFNIMTERPVGDPADIPDLTDDNGCFNMTYGKLIKANYIPWIRGKYKKQIKHELGLQLDRCMPYFSRQGSIRIDSHRHFHMVPFVFDAIAELIEERGLEVSYIRIIHEQPKFYRGIAKFEFFKPVNVIKVMLLNAFSASDRRRHKELCERVQADFASILFSGHMTYRNARLILKNIENRPSAFRENIELMFHPGAVLEEEDLERIKDAEDRAYMSDGLRDKEAEALIRSALI